MTAIALMMALALGLLAVPLTTAAQPAANVPRIACLLPGFQGGFRFYIEGLQRGLRKLGYVEGQNIIVEYRYVEGKAERFPELAAELVRMPVDIIMAQDERAVRAAQHATSTIPIVMLGVPEPVKSGFVDSLARPGGNITGTTSFDVDLSGKRLELLKETLPQFSRVAVLFNARSNPMRRRADSAKVAAQGLGLTLQTVGVQDPNELEAAFAAMTQERPDALLVVLDAFTFMQRRLILDFAPTHRLPAMYELREFVEEGGLMTYGTSFPAWYERSAYYVDRILKGAKPADLPVEQPMKFELVISLKTAQALGLTMPPSLLFQADEVIR
ncbi:MAG TPA: ABC transporter substrate-binding protein [Candidatus Tectomicrobia bacterium]|nr:ABC transporter substrate-binding protein [Candidatus Tectomicrobia bacterium]